MLRPGIITSPLLDSLDTLKKRILLYDELWVPGVSSYLKLGPKESWDDGEEIVASLEWLVSQGFVKDPPFKLNSKEVKER